MANKNENPATTPLSFRITADERRRLEYLAAGMSLGAYIRMRLLGNDAAKRQTRGKFPVKDHTALAQILGLLGKSGLASNVDHLTRAAKSGSLPATPETNAALQGACHDIAAMKRMLMAALGIREH